MTSPENEFLHEPRNWIDGTPQSSSSVERFVHESPRAGTSSIEVPASDLMDVVQAVQTMNRAQAQWQKATRDERDEQIRKLLSHFAASLESSKTKLAHGLALDVGMPVRLARERAIPAAIEIVRKTAGHFERAVSTPRGPSAGNAAVLLGWTDPLVSFCRRVPVILSSDGAVCVKPSSDTPRTASLAAELLIESMKAAGMPLGLFALLHGSRETGRLLLQHPGFKTIYWIGRTEAAVLARQEALEHGKRFHFTGSGRNPLILFQGFSEEIEERLLTQIAGAIVDPHGFGPYRPSRLFVQETIYKNVLARLQVKIESFRSGDPLAMETDIGPLPAKEIKRFETQIQLALSENGHVVCGGSKKDSFAQPTLVRDLTNCSTLQSEELAGPWATVASFKYAHEALKYANTSPLGLAAYVLHPDREKAENIAPKLEASRIFFAGRPIWPDAVTETARPVKISAGHDDGIAAVFNHAQWGSRWFYESLS